MTYRYRSRTSTKANRFAVVSAAALCATTVLGKSAQAQTTPESKAAAEALFKEALRLIESGEYVTACPKLEESQRLDPAVGTLLYLAECYELQGRTASAWATFTSAASAARQAGHAAREATATQRAAALEGRLSKITIVVPADAEVPGLEVTRDRAVVARASLGVAVPVDPGDHVVQAQAPGRKPWSQTIKIEAPGTTIVVNVPVLAEVAEATPPPTKPPTPKPETASPTRPGSADGPKASPPGSPTLPPAEPALPPPDSECPLRAGFAVSALGPDALVSAAFALQPPGVCWLEGQLSVGYNYGSAEIDTAAVDQHGFPILVRGRFWLFETHSLIFDAGVGTTVRYLEGEGGEYRRLGASFLGAFGAGYGYRSEGPFRLGILVGGVVRAGALPEGNRAGGISIGERDRLDDLTEDSLGSGFLWTSAIVPYAEASVGFLFR